jgi:esterase/lipase
MVFSFPNPMGSSKYNYERLKKAAFIVFLLSIVSPAVQGVNERPTKQAETRNSAGVATTNSTLVGPVPRFQLHLKEWEKQEFLTGQYAHQSYFSKTFYQCQDQKSCFSAIKSEPPPGKRQPEETQGAFYYLSRRFYGEMRVPANPGDYTIVFLPGYERVILDYGFIGRLSVADYEKSGNPVFLSLNYLIRSTDFIQQMNLYRTSPTSSLESGNEKPTLSALDEKLNAYPWEEKDAEELKLIKSRTQPNPLTFQNIQKKVFDTLTLAKTLGRKVIVIGHSLGGLLAADAAVRHPELIDALLLSEPALGLKPWAQAVTYFGRLGAMFDSLFNFSFNFRNEINDRRVNWSFSNEITSGIHDLYQFALQKDRSRFLPSGQARVDIQTEQMAAIALGSLIRIPTEIIIASQDNIVENRATRDFARAASAKLLEVKHFLGKKLGHQDTPSLRNDIEWALCNLIGRLKILNEKCNLLFSSPSQALVRIIDNNFSFESNSMIPFFPVFRSSESFFDTSSEELVQKIIGEIPEKELGTGERELLEFAFAQRNPYLQQLNAASKSFFTSYVSVLTRIKPIFDLAAHRFLSRHGQKLNDENRFGPLENLIGYKGWSLVAAAGESANMTFGHLDENSRKVFITKNSDSVALKANFSPLLALETSEVEFEKLDKFSGGTKMLQFMNPNHDYRSSLKTFCLLFDNSQLCLDWFNPILEDYLQEMHPIRAQLFPTYKKYAQDIERTLTQFRIREVHKIRQRLKSQQN